MAREVYDDGLWPDERRSTYYTHSEIFNDVYWADLGRQADEIEAYREKEKARLNAGYSEPAPFIGTKRCSFCRSSNGMLDSDTECPACDGTGFKELITLEDYA